MAKSRVKRHHHKVKTGCTTCRLRRVKCDEEKPTCRRCATAGRKCDGYENQSNAVISLSWENHPWTHSWTPYVKVADGEYVIDDAFLEPQLLLNPHLLVFDSMEEEQSYDYFRSRSVGELTEVFHIDETFWKTCVLQMSMTQPAVRYAVAALGAMHRTYGYGTDTAIPDDTSDATTRFALEQCNRSIKSLLDTKGSEARAEKVSTLVACILYTCLASIQGHQVQSIMHLRNGMKLLDSLAQTTNSNKGQMTYYDSQFESFLTTLSSLEVQARSLLSEEDLPAWPTRTKIRGSSEVQPDLRFHTLSEARDFFESAMSDLQCFVIDRNVDNEWLRQPGYHPRRSSMDEYQLLLKKLAAGMKALDRHIVALGQPTDRDEKMILMLRLHIELLEMYLKVYVYSQEHGELAWDHLEEYYLRLINLAKGVLGCTETNLSDLIRSANEIEGYIIDNTEEWEPPDSVRCQVPPVSAILKTLPEAWHKPVFAFSQGVVGPLSTTAVASRTPKIRREALALLLMYPRREALWDSHTAGRVGWANMCIEEELTRQLWKQQGQDRVEIQTAADIPLECRVRSVDMKYIGSRTGRIRFNTTKESDAGQLGKIVKIMQW